MSGAINGTVTARVPRHYPEFDVFEALPGGEQDVFAGKLAEFLARRKSPLTEPERQLAFTVGRQMWRESTFHGWAVRGRAVRAEMADVHEPDSVPAVVA
jgi:hypothetical protein